MLNTFFAATLLALAYGQCVFNENECQCMEGQSGKTCLRYLGGTAPNIQCEAYACGSGYICDCKFSIFYTCRPSQRNSLSYPANQIL